MLASSCSVCAAPASASCTSCWKPVLCLCSRPYSCRICCSGSLCLCLSVSGPKAPMSTCSWNSGLMSCKACRCQSPRPDASAFWAARSKSCKGRWVLEGECDQNAPRKTQLLYMRLQHKLVTYLFAERVQHQPPLIVLLRNLNGAQLLPNMAVTPAWPRRPAQLAVQVPPHGGQHWAAP